MRSTLFVTIIALALSAIGCNVVIAGDCDHSAPRQKTLDASGADRLVIDAGAGSLSVHGSADATEVRATGTACASEESYLDAIQITGERRGNTLYLKAEYPERIHGQASLDLTVDLPSGLAVRIDDGSGETDVSEVASLELKDGSGGILIQSVAGDVEIDDGSGGIDVKDVRGSLKIDDGSGEIQILGVGGDVTLDDGSGEMTVTGVGGSVDVTDGSGSFTVRDVDRNVTVEEDGSGDMEISGVGGDVLVKEDGSGSIRVHDVQGDFTVRRDGSGSVVSDNVHGRVSVPD